MLGIGLKCFIDWLGGGDESERSDIYLVQTKMLVRWEREMQSLQTNDGEVER